MPLDWKKDDRIKLNAAEMGLMKYFVCATKVIYTCSTKIPNIFDRSGVLEQVKTACDDLHDALRHVTGTMTLPQIRQLDSVNRDLGIVLKPTIATKDDPATILEPDQRQLLVDAARDGKCAYCMLENGQCENCELYKLLTAIQPLQDYSGFLCPYSKG